MQPDAAKLEVGGIEDVDAGGVPLRIYRPAGTGRIPWR